MKKAILLALVATYLGASPVFAKAKAVEGVANINTASVEQLTLLPGVGAKKAETIVSYRTAHPFKATEEITEVKGIGPKMYEKLKGYLTVDGPTTLHEVGQNLASKGVAK